ncbi:MAG: HAD hydrolase-like protein, partial [Gammaproteobacteria bacterium]|nr:HAD hydrolase-like protein [Gammaproteobacteria bacterium]
AHVGDDLHSDIHGANQAGFYSIWLRHAEVGKQQAKAQSEADLPVKPDATVDSISLLPYAIDRLKGKPAR